jgi:hypothetical protein
MAILGYIVCHTCKESSCVGKWLRDDAGVGYGFWRGGKEYPELGLKVLNFLARHLGHRVEILSESFFALPLEEYRDVEDELRGLAGASRAEITHQCSGPPRREAARVK